ncbi:MAG TPA: metalloregulator ArsR/SmtB family transcription factor [Eubacteriales bacterium]|nr:metalloregulator ArsR/SmtB family transcription factor [Eubacteriales bacterium]
MNDTARYPLCGGDHIDKLHEQSMIAHLPDEGSAADAAALFGYLADSTRVRLLSMLSAGEMCVCEMADVLGMSQPAVSHHLRVLRQCGVVGFRKQGQRALYFLSDNETGRTIRRLLSVATGGEEEA